MLSINTRAHQALVFIRSKALRCFSYIVSMTQRRQPLGYHSVGSHGCITCFWRLVFKRHLVIQSESTQTYVLVTAHCLVHEDVVWLLGPRHGSARPDPPSVFPTVRLCLVCTGVHGCIKPRCQLQVSFVKYHPLAFETVSPSGQKLAW